MTNIFLEKQVTKLSFAVILVDDYSGEDPIGKVNVSLKNRNENPIKTPSSYYVFIDFPIDTYTVQVKSDYYSDTDEDLDLNLYNPLKPFVIRLQPNPSYPFPDGSTLVRGMLWNSDDPETRKVIANSKVSGNLIQENYEIDAKTTEKGEFVFCFGRNIVHNENIMINNQVMRISADADVEKRTNNHTKTINTGETIEYCSITESKTIKMDVPKLSD